MRDLPPDLAAHLAGEATTLWHCWRATRRDGVMLGFTDHDEDLAFEGTLFHAGTGLDAAEAASDFGLAVGGGEVAGAFGSDGLTETDLSAGSWDSAKVDMYLVNWREPDQRIRLKVAEIGEVRRAGASFTAELRSMTHRLEAKTGRLFASGCDAEFGDARCGKDLDDPMLRGTGAVLAVQDRLAISALGLEAFEERWFTGGLVHWVTGANAGRTSEVREHRLENGAARFGFWQPTDFVASPGDSFTITAGCDKRFETCRDRFANALNFRGFPHMPGTERALAYPGPEDGEHDGGSLFQ